MDTEFRVALALRSESIAPAQYFFLGAHKFAHTRSNWKIVWDAGTSFLTWEQALRCQPDGILGVLNPGTRNPGGRRTDVKIVILNNEPCEFPQVVADGAEAARRAAAHLLTRRLKHFAFLGSEGAHFSRMRQQGFLEGLEAGGHQGRVITEDFRASTEHEGFLEKWLRTLPLPCGLLCANDLMGMKVIHACRRANLEVPREIAVLGISNYEMICAEAPVTLSSVEQHFEQVGHQGAALLDDLLNGKPAPAAPIFIPPGEVVVRESTRTFGVEDPLVRRALLIIDEDREEPLTMTMLLTRLGNVSQRLVELRFKKVLGRSPYQEILQSRITKARRLLRSTALSLEDIAYKAGFSDPPTFSHHFRKACHQTPSQYRKSSREGGSI